VGRQHLEHRCARQQQLRHRPLRHLRHGFGVYGASGSNVGIAGASFASGQPAIRGVAAANSTGLLGYSGGGSPPVAKAKTGVFGYANQDSGAVGVWGQSPNGRAIQGSSSSSGYAGYFAGRVYTTKWYELAEIANPSAPGSNRARLFVRASGSGKTQLCVRFHTGAVRVIATQP
jgi:hypothetical protein